MIEEPVQEIALQKVPNLNPKMNERRHSNDTYLKLSKLMQDMSLDPRENIDIVVRYTGELIDGKYAIYNRIDDEKGVLSAYSSHNLPPGFIVNCPLDGHICYEATIKGKNRVVAFSNVQDTRYFESDSNIKEYGLRSYLGFPVSLGGKIKGSLCVVDSRMREFSTNDKETIKLFAKILSLSEERMWLNEIIEKRLAYERMIVEISSKCLEVENMEGFLDECLQIMGDTLDVGGIFLWKYDYESDTFSCISEWLAPGIDSHLDDLQDVPAGELPLAMDLFDGNMVFDYQDITEVPEGREKKILEMLSIKSVLTLPLSAEKRIYGFLGFEEYTRHREWSNEDIAILKSICQIISRTIENKWATDKIKGHRDHLDDEVRRRTLELEETNTALRVLLRKMDEDKKHTKKKILFNVDEMIKPHLTDLKNTDLSTSQRAALEIVESNLNDIISPLGHRLASNQKKLSPKEIQVANLIKRGKSTKQMSDLLRLSTKTIEGHRSTIRTKLGIKGKKVNLATFLSSIE